jgi:hypothetical protein
MKWHKTEASQAEREIDNELVLDGLVLQCWVRVSVTLPVPFALVPTPEPPSLLLDLLL